MSADHGGSNGGEVPDDLTGDDRAAPPDPGEQPAGPASTEPDETAIGSGDAAALLVEVRSLRRRTRLARHAYWFPLVLFGVLTCASIPFYIAPQWLSLPLVVGIRRPGLLDSPYLGAQSLLVRSGLPLYWLVALLVGVAATAFWYRWHGRRVGLRTPSRGYLITGLALLVAAMLIPVIAEYAPHRPGQASVFLYLIPGDLVNRGTFPFVIIAIGLCVLAWAERSIALAIVAAAYLSLSLVASLYDLVNVLWRLGWTLNAADQALPNVVLPALVLLLSGAGAWAVQRRQRPLPAGDGPQQEPA
jgi:hypothetical protein